ncbi:unnamed protein product [Amoebophrya sp. A25]|nr:unnamed protein product [Amoebophrya sp. A25]|eukprot:GSA25T00011994001.1
MKFQYSKMKPQRLSKMRSLLFSKMSSPLFGAAMIHLMSLEYCFHLVKGVTLQSYRPRECDFADIRGVQGGDPPSNGSFGSGSTQCYEEPSSRSSTTVPDEPSPKEVNNRVVSFSFDVEKEIQERDERNGGRGDAEKDTPRTLATKCQQKYACLQGEFSAVQEEMKEDLEMFQKMQDRLQRYWEAFLEPIWEHVKTTFESDLHSPVGRKSRRLALRLLDKTSKDLERLMFHLEKRQQKCLEDEKLIGETIPHMHAIQQRLENLRTTACQLEDEAEFVAIIADIAEFTRKLGTYKVQWLEAAVVKSWEDLVAMMEKMYAEIFPTQSGHEDEHSSEAKDDAGFRIMRMARERLALARGKLYLMVEKNRVLETQDTANALIKAITNYVRTHRVGKDNYGSAIDDMGGLGKLLREDDQDIAEDPFSAYKKLTKLMQNVVQLSEGGEPQSQPQKDGNSLFTVLKRIDTVDLGRLKGYLKLLLRQIAEENWEADEQTSVEEEQKVFAELQDRTTTTRTHLFDRTLQEVK